MNRKISEATRTHCRTALFKAKITVSNRIEFCRNCGFDFNGLDEKATALIDELLKQVESQYYMQSNH